jgi:hypothetical protein
MDTSSFVRVPEIQERIILDLYTSGSIIRPMPDKELEDIFYRSLAQNEIVTIRKWMDFLHSGNGGLLAKDPDRALEMLGLFPDEKQILNSLSNYELQRLIEMYYVNAIRERGKCDSSYAGYEPTVVSQIVAKYGLLDMPCAEENIIPVSTTKYRAEPQKQTTRGRGRPAGGKTVIDVQGIEKLRRELRLCKPAGWISKYIGTSLNTVYAAMDANMFPKPRGMKKSIEFHMNTVKRLIQNGDVTWEQYVHRYGLCEKALMKELYASDPEFVEEHDVIPTKDAVSWELEKAKGYRAIAAVAFGVPRELVEKWAEFYAYGKVIPPKKITKHATAKTLTKGAEDTYDDHLRRLGIDPTYDPLASERQKWDREYQIG